MFTSISDIHRYDTRQAKHWNVFTAFKSTSRGQQSITYIGPHVWKFNLSKVNPICSIGSFKRHIRQLLQHCSVSDLEWWSLKLKQNILLASISMWMYIYMHIFIHIFCMYLYVCVWVLFSSCSIYLIIFVREKHKALHCIMAIALYRNVALLLVSMHPVKYLSWNRD